MTLNNHHLVNKMFTKYSQLAHKFSENTWDFIAPTGEHFKIFFHYYIHH